MLRLQTPKNVVDYVAGIGIVGLVNALLKVD